jgi:cytochrome oxidase Cu insertion factor (SCO1/SenC/PrrC family)
VELQGRVTRIASRRLALAAVLVGLLVLPADAADDPLDERLSAFQVTPLGDQASLPFKLESLDGKLVSLADVRGRVAMLYFWEST